MKSGGSADGLCNQRTDTEQVKMTTQGSTGAGALQFDIAWDPAKAQSNIAKHQGVTFGQAATVLLDDDMPGEIDFSGAK
jgi:hypothetical protein